MTALLHDDGPEPWAILAAKLRERDHDPAYADAPVLDAYARISMNPETKQMEKTDRQLADCLDDIRRRRARLGQILRDDNKSANKLHCLKFCDSCRKLRPDFAKLVDRLEARATSGVVCWHTDRLMRQPIDLERLIWFADRGLMVASCFGDYDLENTDQRFMLRILTAKAAADSDALSRRQKRKMKAVRDQGKLGGGPRVFGWPGKDIDPEREREAIVTGTVKFLDGVELAQIARDWNEGGTPTAAGRDHDGESVRRILLHARNAALLEHGGKIIGRLVDVDPIINEQQYEQVRAKMDARKSGRKPSGAHLGSGILRCPYCGSGLRSKLKQKGGLARKYACKCNKISIDQAKTDAVLRRYVAKRMANPLEKQRVVARGQAVAKLDERIDEGERTILEVGRRLADPTDKMTLDRHDNIVIPLDEGLAKLRAEAKALQDEGLIPGPTAESLEAAMAIWDATSTEGKRRMLRQNYPLGFLVEPSTRRGFDEERIQPIKRR